MTEEVKEHKLSEDEELRFEVPQSSEVVVELIDGTGEIFGTELVQHKRYTFGPSSRVALFTWHGCTVELVGKTEISYVAKQTPMVIYVNTHAALEQLRQQTESQAIQGQTPKGPRIMIVGPTDVGKSTYCRILLNFAVRQGRFPTYVDLDVGQGSISVPGTLCALYIERPADPMEGFDKKAPLVYQYGHLSPGDNIPLHNILVQQMASVINERCKSSSEANIGGVVINTCGWVKGAGYNALVEAANAFEVDVVVVLDHERLYNELQRDLPTFVKIVHQPKSGGVEERSREFRISARKNKIRQYFYGGRIPYFPHSFQVSWEEVELFKIGASELPDSCMPLGMKQEDHRTKVVPITPSPTVVHHLFGVSMCENSDDDILRSNVAGFVCITEVNMEDKNLTLLSPQPYPLPRKILVWSDIAFIDDK